MAEPRTLSTEFTSPVILLSISALASNVLVGTFTTRNGVIAASELAISCGTGAGDAIAMPLSVPRRRVSAILGSAISAAVRRRAGRVRVYEAGTTAGVWVVRRKSSECRF